MPELPGLEMPPEQDHWLTKEVDSKEKESRFCSGLTRPDTQFKPLILIRTRGVWKNTQKQRRDG
ncbi:hypothetical protein BEST7613_2316 [Synechocystis sp. PCC 6803]|nr:hypothetical protein BEST7613_2316 [Synechocystis sp. PCC 6803] [Bacillus subtilis BEST7613]